MEKDQTGSENPSRRKTLKKAAVFIVPTILTFVTTELKVYASGLPNPPTPPW